MDKQKGHAVGEHKFIPRISSASRKIAERRLQQLSLDEGIPHFMREIKCQARQPLAPISSYSNEELSSAKTSEENKGASDGSDILKPERDVLKPINMSRASLDDNIFTFKPKVSSASAKIVENLGTDFMARQQQHLERQKKNFEKASYKSSPGHLSPLSQYRRLKERGFKPEEDANLNANPEDCEAPPPDTPTSKSTDRTELEEQGDTMPALHRTKTSISPGLQRILDGPYANGNPDMVLKRHKTRIRASLKGNKSVGDNSDADDYTKDDLDSTSSLSRSKTMPSLGRPKISRKITSIVGNTDRLKNAKEIAEKAIKHKKVFTIQGGYSAIRHSLRKRGWVEKFYRIPGPQKTARHRKHKGGDEDDDNDDDNDDDDDDDDDNDDTDSDNDQPKVPPWEEEDGIYGIMSRMVRNVNPTFIWVLKRDVIDYRFLSKDQMVNHYCKAGSFTTKVGLCVNMRQVPWFEDADPEEFYPRCYRLSHEEEKAAFIDDYRQTACINILKLVIIMYMEGGECSEEGREKEAGDNPEKAEPAFECTNPECTRSRPNDNAENLCVHALEKKAEEEAKRKERENLVPKPLESSRKKKNKKRVIVPAKALDRAMVQCEKYLNYRNHDDIDQPAERDALTPAQWDEMITWYYQLVHEGGIVPNVPANILGQVENILNRIKAIMPQYELDGVKNVWIVKPGAKSRGRGITCYDRLEEMLKLVNSQVVRKDNKYVVQKYIERPLLIYNCKFDIRQWFLVTDWNPLTIYFYQDSYLRFCSQQFTLEDYDESIHLSNNAIQKYYKNGQRAKELPDDNMWDHEQFKDYIKSKRLPNLWDDLIYPGMKRAIICALLCTQDLVEYRKSSFELYGADFMLTEDYKPWLIEINSSPSMESSTEITARLCSNVLEDTLKVAIDRKWDRNCDIGRFELAFKQPVVTVPPYIGISLSADGQAIKKPAWMNIKKPVETAEPIFSPRKDKQVIFNDKLTNNVPDSKGNLRRPHSENNDEDGGTNKKHSTNSAPIKKSSSREVTGDSRTKRVKTQKSPSSSSGLITSHPASQTNSNTCVTAIRSSHSETSSVQSHKPVDTNGESTEESRSDKHLPHVPASPVMVPKTSIFGSGAIPTTSYVANLTSKKIVSRTSVSTNYTIPNMDHREKPALSVNNVETTDLKTLKAQAKDFYVTFAGSYPLTENTWARTCLDCGNGMNLHLDNINPFCKCRQDGIRFSPDPNMVVTPRAKSARNVVRPHSRISPRPPSASVCSNVNCSGGKTKTSTTATTTSSQPSTSRMQSSKKVLLRYTDGGIQRPITPQMFVGSSSLPRLVKRYIGRRVGQYHELSVAHNPAIFIDTSQLNGALSIVSHGFFPR